MQPTHSAFTLGPTPTSFEGITLQPTPTSFEDITLQPTPSAFTLQPTPSSFPTNDEEPTNDAPTQIQWDTTDTYITAGVGGAVLAAGLAVFLLSESPNESGPHLHCNIAIHILY